MLRVLRHMTRGRLLYGWLDCFGAVVRWTDYRPPDGRQYVTKRVPAERRPYPTPELYGEALL